MTKLYEVSAYKLGGPLGSLQGDLMYMPEYQGYSYSAEYIVLGDTPEGAKKALEAYLGKGWEAKQDIRELEEMNKLPLEQRLVLLAELRREIIGKDGKSIKFETKLVRSYEVKNGKSIQTKGIQVE